MLVPYGSVSLMDFNINGFIYIRMWKIGSDPIYFTIGPLCWYDSLVNEFDICVIYDVLFMGLIVQTLGFKNSLSWAVYIHLCRALVITSILLGLFGAVLALVGMKCTKLGGSVLANGRVTFVAGMNYLTSGIFCFSNIKSVYYNVLLDMLKSRSISFSRYLFHVCL